MSVFWPFDFSILNFFQSVRTDFFDFFFSTITHLADKGIFWIALGLLLAVFAKTRKTGVTVLLSLIFSVFLCNILLKNIIARPRPYTVEEWSIIRDAAREILVALPDDWSFPSGHTSASFAAATAIFCCNKKWGVPSLILAALIAFSRIYLYVHYPTDVIAAIFIGGIAGVSAYFITKAILKSEKLGTFFGKFLSSKKEAVSENEQNTAAK